MRASGYARKAEDYYVEPAWCVRALLDLEYFQGRSHDPSCGRGTIPKVMQERGFCCTGSDIADRGYGETGLDFFDMTERVDNIVSNPPYGVINEYIIHALSLAKRKVALIARLALLEGIERRGIFRSTPLARVFVSSPRISMPPGDSDIEAKNGSTAYAWFVWDQEHRGAPTIGWVSKPEKANAV